MNIDLILTNKDSILFSLQSITESLPISSSAHLLTFSTFFGGTNDVNYLREAFMHIIPLIAFACFCWRELLSAIKTKLRVLIKPKRLFYENSEDMVFFRCFVIAVMPTLLVGLVLIVFHCKLNCCLMIVGINSIIFGGLLAFVDYWKSSSQEAKITEKDALVIGLLQTIAFIPGVSRMGICITAARFCGINRINSLKFSCLVAIPVQLCAGGYHLFKHFLYTSASINTSIYTIVLLCFLSFFILFALSKYIRKRSFMIFGLYRIAIGIIISLIGCTALCS
jgi:undecaprenyl-diphosphatase